METRTIFLLTNKKILGLSAVLLAGQSIPTDVYGASVQVPRWTEGGLPEGDSMGDLQLNHQLDGRQPFGFFAGVGQRRAASDRRYFPVVDVSMNVTNGLLLNETLK